jgi:hypothetical protein
MAIVIGMSSRDSQTTTERLALPAVPLLHRYTSWRHPILELVGILFGIALVVIPYSSPAFQSAGLQALGPLLGIMFTVFSLFGELPAWLRWTQRLGSWMFTGIALGAIWLLVPLLAGTATRESSFFAFSPRVWAAYLSIILVSLSFEQSSLPLHIYRYCRSLRVAPAVLVPLYVVVAGLMGNLLDGVSIIAISSVIFLKLLDRRWALRAAFALLFGGLISNLITVAAEPTNIKFQDVLGPLIDRVNPPYWFTNWPICLLGIGLPALALALWMRRAGVKWREHEDNGAGLSPEKHGALVQALDVWLSVLAITLLATGIVLHALPAGSVEAFGVPLAQRSLWLLLLPAGNIAILHLFLRRRGIATSNYLLHELPVWLRLMVIFSLLWLLVNGLTQQVNVFAAFFTWPEPIRYGIMVVLSLASSITDNVALAAMQGSLILNHPLPIWQIRLLFILLTWAGGFTSFGCLQSLALNSRFELSMGKWMREAWVWGILAILGGLAGLALIALISPSAF